MHGVPGNLNENRRASVVNISVLMHEMGPTQKLCAPPNSFSRVPVRPFANFICPTSSQNPSSQASCQHSPCMCVSTNLQRLGELKWEQYDVPCNYFTLNTRSYGNCWLKGPTIPIRCLSTKPEQFRVSEKHCTPDVDLWFCEINRPLSARRNKFLCFQIADPLPLSAP